MDDATEVALTDEPGFWHGGAATFEFTLGLIAAGVEGLIRDLAALRRARLLGHPHRCGAALHQTIDRMPHRHDL